MGDGLGEQRSADALSLGDARTDAGSVGRLPGSRCGSDAELLPAPLQLLFKEASSAAAQGESIEGSQGDVATDRG